MECTPIGCATYVASIVNRRTGQASIDCPDLGDLIDGINYHRTKRAVSTCDLTIILLDGQDGASCCGCKIKPWRDVVRIQRCTPDGRVEGLAWEGVVTLVTEDYDKGTMSVQASDWAVDAARRPEARTTITGSMDEAELWYALFVDAITGGFGFLNPDGWAATGKKVEADITAATATALGTNNVPYLTGNTLSSVDWCVIGRRLYGPGPTLDSGNIWGTLHTSRDWDDRPAIQIDGTGVASQYRLGGKNKAQEDIVGFYPPNPVVDPDLGLHNVTSVLGAGTWTVETLTAEAAVRWRAHQDNELFLVTNNATLSKDCPVCFFDLIPGRLFLVDTDNTCTKLTSAVSLINVAVDVTPDNDGVLREERVAIDFHQPESLSLPSDLLSL